MISPHKTPDLQPPEPPSVTDDQAWEAVKKRRPVGQVVFGETVQIERWGAFFDIGERFHAFIDPLDLQDENLLLGSRRCLRILQHADWNRQLRVTFATQKELFVATMSPLDRAQAARLEGELLKFRDEFNSWPQEEQNKFREAIWLAARSDDILGLLSGGFRNMLASSEEYFDHEGNVTDSSSWGRFSPKVLFQAVDAWSRGDDFLPASLFKLYAARVPDALNPSA